MRMQRLKEAKRGAFLAITLSISLIGIQVIFYVTVFLAAIKILSN